MLIAQWRSASADRVDFKNASRRSSISSSQRAGAGLVPLPQRGLAPLAIHRAVARRDTGSACRPSAAAGTARAPGTPADRPSIRRPTRSPACATTARRSAAGTSAPAESTDRAVQECRAARACVSRRRSMCSSVTGPNTTSVSGCRRENASGAAILSGKQVIVGVEVLNPRARREPQQPVARGGWRRRSRRFPPDAAVELPDDFEAAIRRAVINRTMTSVSRQVCASALSIAWPIHCWALKHGIRIETRITRARRGGSSGCEVRSHACVGEPVGILQPLDDFDEVDAELSRQHRAAAVARWHPPSPPDPSRKSTGLSREATAARRRRDVPAMVWRRAPTTPASRQPRLQPAVQGPHAAPQQPIRAGPAPRISTSPARDRRARCRPSACPCRRRR